MFGLRPIQIKSYHRPNEEEITAPTTDSPNIAVMRLGVDIYGKLKNRTQKETTKPSTSGKPKTMKSESAQEACNTARLR